jgi:tRNA threonylcarbamoyladenosine biosynthesis protein TsaB
MASLFIDSSDYLQMGLLDDNYQWLEHFILETKKGSQHLHPELNRILTKNDCSLENIDCLFYVAGPGSYTGIRLVEGLAQFLAWQKKTVYSLYGFEVPRLLGHAEGQWVSEAFKGELFIHSWGKFGEREELVAKDSFDDLPAGPLFSHRDEIAGHPAVSTAKLIFEQPKPLFSLVHARATREGPYYYRELEDEFRVPR